MGTRDVLPVGSRWQTASIAFSLCRSFFRYSLFCPVVGSSGATLHSEVLTLQHQLTVVDLYLRPRASLTTDRLLCMALPDLDGLARDVRGPIRKRSLRPTGSQQVCSRLGYAATAQTASCFRPSSTSFSRAATRGARHTVEPAQPAESLKTQKLMVAERVGFEPTCPLRDKTLSRRPRYDHFGTSPVGCGRQA
jgi:hypothetical protein